MTIEGLSRVGTASQNKLKDLLLECDVLLAHELASLPNCLLQTDLGLWNKCELEESTFEIFNKFLCQVAPRLIPNKVHYILDVCGYSLISVDFSDHGWPPRMPPHFGPNYFLPLKFRHGVPLRLLASRIVVTLITLFLGVYAWYNFDTLFIFLFLH